MKIYWLSDKKRREVRRELIDEEKEIMVEGGIYGFLTGTLILCIIWWFWANYKIIVR